MGPETESQFVSQFVSQEGGISWWYNEETEEMTYSFEDCPGG